MIVLICAPVTLNFPTAAVVVGKITGLAEAETIIPAETTYFLTSMHSVTLAATLNKVPVLVSCVRSDFRHWLKARHINGLTYVL